MFFTKQAVQQAFQGLIGTKNSTKTSAKPSSYVPDFTRCIDHFAIHAGEYTQYTQEQCSVW